MALAVDEGCLGGPETPIRARKGSGLAEISAMQGVAPPEACRRVSQEIDFSGLSGGAVSALAVDQGYLGGPETRIRARKGSGLAKISVIRGVAPPEALRGSHKSVIGNRLLRLARRVCFGLGRRSSVFRRSAAVRKHESARGKGQD